MRAAQPKVFPALSEIRRMRSRREVAVRCDHTADAEVEALFARVTQELVNNVWGGYEQHDWSPPSGSSPRQPVL
jgi:hypothetical protein